MNETSPNPTPTPPAQDRIVRTTHTMPTPGGTLPYDLEVGTVVLREEAVADGNRNGFKAKAELFFMAYTAKAEEPNPKRPITFCFNGGPGSSSVWLHLGLLGPKRVKTSASGHSEGPPGELIDNPLSLLVQSDLVFIDPIGTGFSRMLNGEKVKEFHDYQRDLDSVGEFIRSYLSRTHRWASPKYLIGESYGTTRAAGLSQHLQDRYQIDFNGLMLISCAMDFSTLRFDAGNDLPYALFLPTYAATAWFHKKLSPAQQAKTQKQVVREAEAFVTAEYLPMLFKGSRITQTEATAFAEKLAQHCGLPAEMLARCNLRPTIYRFCKELLRSDGLTVGRLDSRFTAQDRDDQGEMPEFDAAHANLQAVYAAQINHYLRHTAQFDSPEPYEVMQKFYLDWSYKSFMGRYPNAAEAMRAAMHRNPHLRIYVASGYTDLATPHFASEYVLNHAITRREHHERIQISEFDAGHMMYIHQADFERLCAELAAFVTS